MVRERCWLNNGGTSRKLDTKSARCWMKEHGRLCGSYTVDRVLILKKPMKGIQGCCLCKKECLPSNFCHSPPGGGVFWIPPSPLPTTMDTGISKTLSHSHPCWRSAGSNPATLSDLQLDRQVGAVTAPLLRWVEQLMWEWEVCSRGQRRYTMGRLGPHPHLPKNQMTRSDGNKVWKTIIWYIF